MKTFFFFWRALALVSLVLGLGLEHSCPWPRECLSSERLSLASDFFCVLGLGLEPCVLDSTCAHHRPGIWLLAWPVCASVSPSGLARARHRFSGAGGERHGWCTKVLLFLVIVSIPPDEPINEKQPVAGFLNFSQF